MTERWVTGPDAAQLLGINRAALEVATMAMERSGLARRDGSRWLYDAAALGAKAMQDRGAAV